MKKILLYSFIVISLFATSCSKWLDVQPEKQTAAEKLFETYSGFKDALNGCYIKLKDRNLYGEKLTMTNIESMAQLWKIDETYLPVDFELMTFKYTGDNAKAASSTIYSGLYNVIAQTNMIIKYVEEKGSVIPNPANRAVIEGEAYAIRAFCHFDILRLFGQLPKNATKQVSLPYAEIVSSNILPSYYNYDQFVAKIQADLDKAELLFKDNDPIFKYTFSYLNSYQDKNQDDFIWYRQNHFNYWAVKALQARLYLYTGNTQKAYSTAKSIIEAKGADGKSLITLSGATDIPAGYIACPSECLMMLNSYSIMTYSPNVLGTGAQQIRNTNYVITQAQLNKLFENQGTASNNRYNNVWSRTVTDPSGTIYPTLKKYYYETATSETSSVSKKNQVIPLIRLSEMYLILMETTGDLNEANTLWSQYQLSHNVQVSGNVFESMSDVKKGIMEEYRREFYGEGQMFYTYKRLGSTSMLWRNAAVSEDNYIVPLPDTEYNPNSK